MPSERRSADQERVFPVSIDPDISGGLPVFSGTRVPIDTLLAYVDAGKSLDEYLLDYDVARWQIDAILAMPREHARALAVEYARPSKERT